MFYKHATIEYDYIKKDDSVYYKWRFAGTKRWNYRLTPHKEIPYVKLDLHKSYDESQAIAKKFMNHPDEMYPNPPSEWKEPENCSNMDACPTEAHGTCCQACDHDYPTTCCCHLCSEERGCHEN